MTNALTKATNIVLEVLEHHHPTAVIKHTESGVSDIRVCTSSSSESIVIQAYAPYTITDEDIQSIVQESTSLSENKMLEYDVTKTEDGSTDGLVWFKISPTLEHDQYKTATTR